IWGSEQYDGVTRVKNVICSGADLCFALTKYSDHGYSRPSTNIKYTKAFANNGRTGGDCNSRGIRRGKCLAQCTRGHGQGRRRSKHFIALFSNIFYLKFNNVSCETKPMKDAGEYLDACFEFFRYDLICSQMKELSDLGYVTCAHDDVDITIQGPS